MPPRDAAVEDYADAVLDLVDAVPPARVTTYGDVAEVLRDAGWGGGPRTVGAVMARHGGAVAWWRVVRSDGGLPLCDPAEALARHRSEGTVLTRTGRVDLAVARADLPAGRPPYR